MLNTKEAIKKAIELAGSQTLLADKINVTRQMVCRWSKTGKISIHHYLKINQLIEYDSIKRDKNNKNS